MAHIVAHPERVVVFEFDSYIRGYHAYMDRWEYEVGEVLPLRREPDNEVDVNSVAIMKDEEIVRHVPFNLTRLISQFLQRDVNVGFVEVTGERVNQGAGYGVELPCKYRLYGPAPYINKLKELIAPLKEKKLL